MIKYREIIHVDNLEYFYRKKKSILLGKMEPIFRSPHYIIYIDSYIFNHQVYPRITISDKKSYDDIISTRINNNFKDIYKNYITKVEQLEKTYKKER